jgi:hypothetical protein
MEKGKGQGIGAVGPMLLLYSWGQANLSYSFGFVSFFHKLVLTIFLKEVNPLL